MHPIRYSKKEKRKIKEDFIIALGETLGIKGKAAKQCGVDVRTIDHWRQDDPDFDQSCKLVEDVPLDFAESALFQQIAKGDTKAITFYLENKGASRGYSKRQSIDVNADVKVSGKPNVIMDEMEEIED